MRLNSCSTLNGHIEHYARCLWWIILSLVSYKHELTNLFGEFGNGGLFFLNGYLPFHDGFCYLGKHIENRPGFDMSFVHLRYNKEAIEKVMKPNTKKISILRHPEANFISSYRYYAHMMMRMRSKLRSYNETHPRFDEEISEFLESPRHHLSQFHYDSNEYMFTMNPQFLFFGYPSYLMVDRKGIWQMRKCRWRVCYTDFRCKKTIMSYISHWEEARTFCPSFSANHRSYI